MMKMKQKARFRPQRVRKTNREREPQIPDELSPPSEEVHKLTAESRLSAPILVKEYATIRIFLDSNFFAKGPAVA